jgi:hypothetical protein
MVLIAPRQTDAISGSEFIKINMNVSRPTREANILKEFLSGNIPDFLRQFTPIVVSNGNDNITYLTTTDCLSIGSDDDYVRMPMNPLTAQQIADQYDCTLPTRKMVHDIWKQSINKLDADELTWGPPYDDSMMNTDRIHIHNDRINKLMVGKDNTKLISGHKKDVVLTNKLYPNNPKKRVAIYGWIKLDGQPIQGLNYWSHEETYADYSHSIRLITNDVMVNGNPMRIQDVFQDAKLFALLSDEGPLSFLRY